MNVFKKIVKWVSDAATGNGSVKTCKWCGRAN